LPETHIAAKHYVIKTMNMGRETEATFCN